MSSEYYFQQWKKMLHNLEEIVCLDIEYQEAKAHDKSWCDAALRLSGMLGSYIVRYNEALECYQQNLQVQKSEDIQAIVKAIVARILELKEQLRKHEGSYYQFISGGLINHKLTPYDAELNDIPDKYQRPQNIQRILKEVFAKAREEKHKEEFNESINELVYEENVDDWWNEPNNAKDSDKRVGINIAAIYEVKEIISEETLNRRKIISLIQAHERMRQLTQKSTVQKQRRHLWEKELKGTLIPPARLEIREKAAIIIQRVLRMYFKIKRKRIRDCKYDELMGIKLCKKPDRKIQEDERMFKLERSQRYSDLNAEWTIECAKIKNNFIKQRSGDIADDFRLYIREWFKKWFDEAKFFLDIPKENHGGLCTIIKEEISSPSDWLKEYKTYIEQKKANKNKTATELKWEKMEAKREEITLRNEDIMRKKQEAELLKKIMKNPKMHPGYHYPKSKKIQHIVKAAEDYKRKWLSLDELDYKGVKEGFLKEIDIINIYAKAKEEILATIDGDMREELKKLKQALKDDYTINDEVIPENIKRKLKRIKKKQTPKPVDEEYIFQSLTDFAVKDVFVEYPITRFKDFSGESNFAGDDLKCNLSVVQPLGGETLSIWWEKCLELTHSFKKVLLIGPKSSGKTLLVHAMATINDATLYDINLLQFYKEPVKSLRKIFASLMFCAKTAQPSVIYIRHVHRLYYRKAQPNEINLNSTTLKKILLKRLIKKIQNSDKITLIGSCVDPWLTNSKQMLKHFPNVVMMPPSSYTTTQLLLQKWVLNNRILPSTLDVQSLAHVLKGYSFGYLKNILDEFLSPDRIIRIAAYGLTSNEIFDYFLQYETEKVDYDKYRKWYDEKTHWGKIETKYLKEQIEFKNIVEKWKEKEERKKKKL